MLLIVYMYIIYIKIIFPGSHIFCLIDETRFLRMSSWIYESIDKIFLMESAIIFYFFTNISFFGFDRLQPNASLGTQVQYLLKIEKNTVPNGANAFLTKKNRNSTTNSSLTSLGSASVPFSSTFDNCRGCRNSPKK